MDNISTPTILVIIGITGDLSQRYLLPAIQEIARAGVLPESFKIVGVSRRPVSMDDVLPEGMDELRGMIEIRQMDLADPAAYEELKVYLRGLASSFDTPAQWLFYLSVPPQVSRPVVELLGKAGFGKEHGVKLLLEKPFGTDASSAWELVDEVRRYFHEDQLYRIDHYLAKEMVQNVVVFRGANSLFKRTWNKEFIEAIEITAKERIGIEGRAGFYEQTGALRDVLQSHLLQLLALVLMELPEGSDWHMIPAARLAALEQVVPPRADQVTRAQYEGYREEVGNTGSMTETFASLTLYSNDPRWEGVPVTLTTGKALDTKATEIKIHYRRESDHESNCLVLRIQPNEGVEVDLWAKEPGYARKMHKVALDFSYHGQFSKLPDAYERVFVDAMRSDHSLFTTSEEVLAAWRILAPVQQAWGVKGDDLIRYAPGSRVEEIIARSGERAR